MDLSKFEGAEDVTVEEEVNNTKVTVNATKVKETETTIEATKVKETTVEVNEVEVVEEVAVAQSAHEVQAERQPTPEPAPAPAPEPTKGETTEEPDAEETVIQAERTPTPTPPKEDEKNQEAADDDEEKIVFSPVEETANDAEGDDIIQVSGFRLLYLITV